MKIHPTRPVSLGLILAESHHRINSNTLEEQDVRSSKTKAMTSTTNSEINNTQIIDRFENEKRSFVLKIQNLIDFRLVEKLGGIMTPAEK